MKPNLAGARRWNAGRVAVGIVLLLGSVASFAAASALAAPQPQFASSQRVAQATDPVTLFNRLMPVLTSPRCVNCHGGTDPVNGTNHGGGAVGSDAVCQDCHTASADWVGVSGIQFVTDVMPMCQTMRHIAQVLGPSAFVNFLATDPVVGLGFDGLRGMDENSPYWPVDAEPPPMTRGDFVAAAQQWVTDGQAQCSKPIWTGNIVQKSSDKSVGPDRDNVRDMTLSVNVNGDSSTAALHVEGHSNQDGAITNGCRQYDHETYSADGTVPAEVQVMVNAPPSTDGDSAATTGSYLVNFRILQPVQLTTVTETQGLKSGSCQRNVTTRTTPLAPPPTGDVGVTSGTGGAINKPVVAGQTDQLTGTDTQTAGAFTLTRTWDLTQGSGASSP